MIKRLSIKRPVAWIALVGVLFAQMAMAAYAFDGAPERAEAGIAAAAPDGSGGSHCTGVAPEPAPANVCEVHCTDGVASPSGPVLPPVLLTALPCPVLAHSALDIDSQRAWAPDATLAGAPPPTLRYCRLLL